MKVWFKYLFFLLVMLFAGLCGAFWFLSNHNIIDISQLEQNNIHNPSIIYDDEGNELGHFSYHRNAMKLQNVPNHLIQAFLAAEDRHFFDHMGISIKGILRSIIVNLYHRKKVQGASTITQQLVRLLYFDTKKTFKRKIKEQFYALLIEQQCSKEQILQTYLNNIYFGCGIYGIQAASNRFWGKSVESLSLSQSATLAAIIKSPARYCPLLQLDQAKKRRNDVLGFMKQCGFINNVQYLNACNEPMNVNGQQEDQLASHLKETIRVFLEQLVGKDQLYNGGLRIQTTINKNIQRDAEKYIFLQMNRLRQSLNENVDAALISMGTKTGEIKALVGGYNYKYSKFNRALQAKRQIGSIFKPVLYAAALREGLDFTQTVIDEPIQIQYESSTWEPQNDSRSYHGQMTLAWALSRSNNVVAAKTIAKIGCKPVALLGQKSRLGKSLHLYPSLALGCIDCSLKQVAGMFNIFANHGKYIEPHFIRWIKDQWGNKIWTKNPEHEQILSSDISDQVAKVLELNMKEAQLKRNKNQWIDSDAIGKTGTTNDSRTCWFAGSTPEMTTAIYIGCDNNASIGDNIYASKTAFPIWLALHKTIPCLQKHFDYSRSLRECFIDYETGKQVSKTEPKAIPILLT